MAAPTDRQILAHVDMIAEDQGITRIEAAEAVYCNRMDDGREHVFGMMSEVALIEALNRIAPGWEVVATRIAVVTTDQNGFDLALFRDEVAAGRHIHRTITALGVDVGDVRDEATIDGLLDTDTRADVLDGTGVKIDVCNATRTRTGWRVD